MSTPLDAILSRLDELEGRIRELEQRSAVTKLFGPKNAGEGRLDADTHPSGPMVTDGSVPQAGSPVPLADTPTSIRTDLPSNSADQPARASPPTSHEASSNTAPLKHMAPPRDAVSVSNDSGRIDVRDRLDAFLAGKRIAPSTNETSTDVHAPQEHAQDGSLERMIGGTWFLVLGALIVVAGIGLFMKLAWDQGWLGSIPPIARCLAAAGFGLALIIGGELARSRLGGRATAGFTAAGLGTLYATAFGSFAIFELIGPFGAFWLLLAVAALGVGLGFRGKSPWISGLSVIGAYTTPILAGNADAPAWTLPSYLTAVFIGASVIALIDRRHRACASIAWWGTLLLGSAWVFMQGFGAPAIGLVFLAAVWAIAHGICYRLLLPEQSGKLVALTSVATTGWAVAHAIIIAESTASIPSWSIAAYAAGTVVAAAMIRGFGLVLLQQPKSPREVLAVTLMCQAGALLPLTIFLAINEDWVLVAIWLSLAVASVATARTTRAAALLAYAGVMLGLAAMHLLIGLALGIEALTSTTATVYGLVFGPWMLFCGLLAAVWIWAGFVTRGFASPDRPVFASLAVPAFWIGALHATAAVLHPDATSASVMLGWALMLAFTLALPLTGRFTEAWKAGVWFAAITSAAWLARFTTLGWAEYVTERAVIHPGLVWSVLIAGAWWSIATYARRQAGEARQTLRVAALLIVGGFLLTGTSLEAARFADMMTTDETVRSGAISLWWAIFAVVCLLLGVVRQARGLRYVGIGLLLVATGKVLTYDIANQSQIVRVTCFLALGLTLLTVAAAYLRVAKRSSDKAQNNTVPDDDTISR